jgi:hypothetical protein
VEHAAARSAGDATTLAEQRPLEMATFVRFRENKNVMPCGAFPSEQRTDELAHAGDFLVAPLRARGMIGRHEASEPELPSSGPEG